MTHPEYCVVCARRRVPEGCGQHDCADGNPPNRFVPFYGRPPTHWENDGCHNCQHLYTLRYFEGGQDTFCHRDGSYRPPNGECPEYPGEWCVVFFDDVLLSEPTIIDWDTLWHNAMGMYWDAWEIWAAAHRVKPSDKCSEWKKVKND
jgi:hypothetical protein